MRVITSRLSCYRFNGPATIIQPCAEVRHPSLPSVAQTVVRDIVTTGTKSESSINFTLDVCRCLYFMQSVVKSVLLY
jgi:hypothetical protein